MKVKSEREVAQLCPTLSKPMDCSPPGSSVHGVFQARVLEWGAIAFSDIYIYLYTYIREEKGMTEDEMVGWHHQLDGHEFEQAPGVGDGQGGLACCSPLGCKKLDMTE